MATWEQLRMIRSGKVPAEAWNALVDKVREATIESVQGGLLARTPGGGTRLTIAAGGSTAAAAARPLVLTEAAPANAAAPAADTRPVWCSFGTVDGFIPSNIDTAVATIDTTSATEAERRIYIKATPGASTGFLVTWSAVILEASPTAAIGASVLPPHGAITATGEREYYILPIGRVRWYGPSAATPLVLVSDDSGSFRSYARTGPASYQGGDYPDNPPVLVTSQDRVFVRGNQVYS